MIYYKYLNVVNIYKYLKKIVKLNPNTPPHIHTYIQTDFSLSTDNVKWLFKGLFGVFPLLLELTYTEMEGFMTFVCTAI